MLFYQRARIRNWARQRLPRIYEQRIGIGLSILAVLVVLLFFREFVQMIAVMVGFIILGILSMMYNRFIRLSLGFELILLGTVITGMVYGRLPALIVGMVALFFAEVFSGAFQYKTFVSFIGMFVTVMAIPVFEDLPIGWAGLLLTILYDAIIIPGYLLMGSQLWRSAVFTITHIMFNAWIFFILGPPLLSLLS